jgi:hypothetical protein
MKSAESIAGFVGESRAMQKLDSFSGFVATNARIEGSSSSNGLRIPAAMPTSHDKSRRGIRIASGLPSIRLEFGFRSQPANAKSPSHSGALQERRNSNLPDSGRITGNSQLTVAAPF